MPAQRTRDIHSRTLDVTTDVQEQPSFNIVSPTPRAFNFTATNNLSDSPYSSRSPSPMETDPFSFPAQQQCTLSTSFQSSPAPYPQPIHADSLISPLEAISLQRRKSSCSSDTLERRPKKGEDDYIKRPENAFILFRRKCCEDKQAAQEAAAASAKGPAKKQRQADLSKTISQQWKSLSNEERAKWEEMAKSKKLEHEKKYPHYVYRPQRAKDKDGKTKNNKKAKKPEYDESNTLSYQVPYPPTRQHGRSNSAPSPPPFQSIRVPAVYHMHPGSPTSPSLVPLISRRSAHPGHSQEAMYTSFDYLPTSQPYVPPAYAVSGQFEETLQSSEFLRSMFGPSIDQQQDTTSPLQQLTIPEHNDTPHQVSPSSSVGSSSGPSSPSSGPYTPNSGLLFTHLSPDASLEVQAQAEMDLQREMQMQEYAANSIWDSSEPSILLRDDFDINSIQAIVTGFPIQMSKYTESITIPPQYDAGPELEYGHEYAGMFDNMHFSDESRSLGIIGFDEMMAGHGF